MVECPPPPNVTLFRVIETDSKSARLVWAHQYVFKALSFHYELEWWNNKQGEFDTSSKLILNHKIKSTYLSDLQPRSHYSSRISIRNACGRKSLPLTLDFSTKHGSLNPAHTQTMPHEMILIALILILWLLILRHFIIKYNKYSFVSPNTIFIHGRRYSEAKTNKNSDVDSLRRGSEISKASKVSVTNKFELLENAIQHWRSETVLEMRNPITNKDVASVLDKTDISSTFSAENGRKFSMSRRKRRTSNATDDLHILKVPSKREAMHKMSTISVRPSQSYPLFTKIGSSSMLRSFDPPQIYYEDYDSIVNAPPCSPNKFPKFEDETDEVSEEELERCRLLAKLSGPRPNTSEMLQRDGTMRRKVSEILLGKATIDIRRCSSISAYIRRPRASKHALIRRPSLLQSFRQSFRKSFHRKRQTSNQGCNANRFTSSSMPSRWFRSFQLSEKQEEAQMLETPPYQRSSKDTTSSSSPSNKCVKMQMSTESYFTASDVALQIDPAED